jgi:hypothetical protein
LLNFKNATGTLQIADNFYGTVQNFKDNLDRNESDQELIESYRYVEEYGTIFRSHLQCIEEPGSDCCASGNRRRHGGTAS